jgi:methylthioribose-1-phosphate isomerase
MTAYFTLQWEDDHVVMLDQRLLPGEVRYIPIFSVEEMAEAIRNMTVRGAPAIGAAAAYGMALAALTADRKHEKVYEQAAAAQTLLFAARPTAVNLGWALRRMRRRLDSAAGGLNNAEMAQTLLAEAHAIAEEDRATNRRMAENALALLPDEVTFIHHCNTGTLATVEYGTALGVIRAAHEHGKKVLVYVDETRPRLQGARLTAWELTQLGIPYQIIVDGAAAAVMRTRHVDACVVGCDRVAANGDTANKIGTYNLSIVAKAHQVPFYVVGPTSTVDLETPTGAEIVIEERAPEEITEIEGRRIAPEGAQVFNPAFDVTLAANITAIITEEGVCRAPFIDSLRAAVQRARDVD